MKANCFDCFLDLLWESVPDVDNIIECWVDFCQQATIVALNPLPRYSQRFAVLRKLFVSKAVMTTRASIRIPLSPLQKSQGS